MSDLVRFTIDPSLSDQEIADAIEALFDEPVEKHGGPGPHKGTGTDQSVHGKGGSVSGQGGGESGSIPDSARELLEMNTKMEEKNTVQYPEDVKQAAADLLQVAIYREAELSPIVQAAAGNAEFKGWDHRIKYTPSIASKITRNMAELERAGLEPTLEEGVRMVSDLNRYTILSDNESFIRNFSSVVDDLERAGWTSWDHKIKNYFAVRNDSFDGIVSKFRNDSGAILEIQFHTKNSAEIAELSHELYNQARELPEGDPRRQELAREMVALWNSSTDHIPEGVFEIGTPSEQLFKHAMHNQKDHGNWADFINDPLHEGEGELRWIDPESLQPYMMHSAPAKDWLMTSLQENGFKEPLTLTGPDLMLADGNHRLAAALRIGMDRVPVVARRALFDELMS